MTVPCMTQANIRRKIYQVYYQLYTNLLGEIMKLKIPSY
jgi:hypothetical protein